MKVPLTPMKECDRLTALYEYEILDTPCEDVFENITKIAASICNVPISLINIIDKDRVWSKSSYGLKHVESARNISFCAHAIFEPDIMEVNNLLEDERFMNNPFVIKEPKFRFYAGVPLINANGIALGTLCVIDIKENKLTEEQKKNLRHLSKMIISIFELKKTIRADVKSRSEMHDALSRANKQFQTNIQDQKIDIEFNTLLGQMNGLLQSCITDEEAYKVIINYCQKLFSDTSGSFYLIDASLQNVNLIRQWNSPHSNSDLFPKIECWGLRRGQLHFALDPKKDLLCQHFTQPQSATPYICLPLTAQSEILGLLCIEHDKQIFNLHPDDNHYLSMVRAANQIALALTNIKLRQTLRQQSICDPLSGLFNRRYLSEIIKRELSRATINHKNLGVLLIDIDHFKKFNDTYGHDAGDLVIKVVAGLLMKKRDLNDVAFRLGGEEFVLLTQIKRENDLIEFANELRKEISEVKLQYAGQSLGKITFSIGLAVFPKHGDSLDALINAADSALYRAKETGRDKVVMYNEDKIKLNQGIIRGTSMS